MPLDVHDADGPHGRSNGLAGRGGVPGRGGLDYMTGADMVDDGGYACW